jgi:hypothetical protein
VAKALAAAHVYWFDEAPAEEDLPSCTTISRAEAELGEVDNERLTIETMERIDKHKFTVQAHHQMR